MNAEKKAQEKKTMQDGDDGTTKTKTDYTKHKKAPGQSDHTNTQILKENKK